MTNTTTVSFTANGQQVTNKTPKKVLIETIRTICASLQMEVPTVASFKGVDKEDLIETLAQVEMLRRQTEKEQINESANVESAAAEQTTPQQEENPMPTQPSVQDQILAQLAAQSQVNTDIQSTLNQTVTIMANLMNRMEELETKVNQTPVQNPVIIDQAQPQLEAPKQELTHEQKVAKTVAYINRVFGAPVATETMSLEAMNVLFNQAKEKEAASVPEPVVTYEDPNQVVFSESQMLVLESSKHNMSLYNSLKEQYEITNRRLGLTVANGFKQAAGYVNQGGHKSVDAVSDVLGSTIDSVKNIAQSALDLSATTLHSANNVTRATSHMVINGVTYSLDKAGNIIAKN